MKETNTRTFHKLVRDRIPEIIEKSGKQALVRTLDEEEYRKHLDEKLSEEMNEYFEAHNLEELADLLEVIYASAKLLGASEEALNKVRLEKKQARGGFEKRILLEKTFENL